MKEMLTAFPDTLGALTFSNVRKVERISTAAKYGTCATLNCDSVVSCGLGNLAHVSGITVMTWCFIESMTVIVS